MMNRSVNQLPLSAALMCPLAMMPAAHFGGIGGSGLRC